jgi:hypothetical protein
LDTNYRTLEIVIYIIISTLIVNNVVWTGIFSSDSLTYDENSFPLCPEAGKIP